MYDEENICEIGISFGISLRLRASHQLYLFYQSIYSVLLSA
jgi:hypothetical protein